MRDILLRLLARLRAFGPDKSLVALAGILVVLLLVQGLRYRSLAGLEETVIGSLEQAKGEVPKRTEAKELKEYDPITQQGLLGTVSKPPPQKLWGIMGEYALIGPSSGNAKPYKVGDKLSTGEKIVKIGCSEVVLEKDGKQRTESVFPELKKAAKPREKPARRSASSPGSPPKTETEQAPGEKVSPAPSELDEGSSAEPESEGPRSKEDEALERAAEALKRKLKELEVREQ